jgi:hypothetical protein
MILKDDILERINSDFGENAKEAINMLTDAVYRVEYPETDRVVRCIVFLAKGSITALKGYIEAATIDPRDVMLWAEYEQLADGFNVKRLRDFNNTFNECAINAKT